METKDKKRFGMCILAMAEYYGKPMSDAVIEIYWRGLEGYDVESIEKATARHMQNPDSGQFMPKIADIVKMLEGSTQDSAFLAWSLVDKAVRQIGTGESVDFGDQIIHKVLSDMGGWTSLGTKTEDEWPFVAKEFENRYRGYKSRGDLPEAPNVLIGNYDHANSVLGYKTNEPVKIGNALINCKMIDNGEQLKARVQQMRH